jgi:hypothetical protein
MVLIQHKNRIRSYEECDAKRLLLEAVSSAIHQHIPDEGILHSHRCETLKSYNRFLILAKYKYDGWPLLCSNNFASLLGTLLKKIKYNIQTTQFFFVQTNNVSL